MKTVLTLAFILFGEGFHHSVGRREQNADGGVLLGLLWGGVWKARGGRSVSSVTQIPCRDGMVLAGREWS